MEICASAAQNRKYSAGGSNGTVRFYEVSYQISNRSRKKKEKKLGGKVRCGSNRRGKGSHSPESVGPISP